MSNVMDGVKIGAGIFIVLPIIIIAIIVIIFFVVIMSTRMGGFA